MRKVMGEFVEVQKGKVEVYEELAILKYLPEASEVR